jgi:hypothetical protein
MRKHRFEIIVGIALVALSAGIYVLHFVLFEDMHHIFIYLLGDIAFVPMEVLLVTLILHKLLEVRERHSMMNKLNMVIGAFFSEAGTELMKRLSALCPDVESLRADLVPTGDWTKQSFDRARADVACRECRIEATADAIADLKPFLVGKRPFLLALLENPNLLEHESFTNLLWAVFHLAEELSHRDDVTGSPKTDLEHVAGDIRRVYGQITGEWLSYMEHLKAEYPYLFSLAVRTNPFDPKARVVVA